MPIDVQLMGMLQCPKVQGEGKEEEGGGSGASSIKCGFAEWEGTFQLKGMQRKKA